MNKPKIYQNKINKTFHNNRTIYTSYNHKNNLDIKNKIIDIINSNNFIYSKTVHLIINGDTITRKIIGLQNNNLITIDNESIPISNINDIYI